MSSTESSILKSNEINIARMYYPVKTLGPGNRIGIWFAGCHKRCEECVTPELQNPKNGAFVSISVVMDYINKCKDFTGFTISGGEPFFYPYSLRLLVEELTKITDDIIIFSGYTLSELKQMKNEDIEYVLGKIGVLIDGPYIKELNDGTGLRGSSNQNIIIFRHADLYNDLDSYERCVQVIYDNHRIMTIGIPQVLGHD